MKMTEAEKMAARVKVSEPEEEKKSHSTAAKENLIDFEEDEP
jgi:hypothetical protein